MANQHPTQPAQPTYAQPPAQQAPAHAQPTSAQRKPEQRKPEQRADPANAQYMIGITPEQYESVLKQAQVSKEPPLPRQQMEMGGEGTAKAQFKDAFGGDVKLTGAEWSATGPVTVTADEKDPTGAKIFAYGTGPATITVHAHSDDGSTQASVDVMVIAKGAPVEGKIELSVQPATDEGKSRAAPSGQILPVPAPAPPQPHAQPVPPAQTLSQPSPQPQPQDKDKDKAKSK